MIASTKGSKSGTNLHPAKGKHMHEATLTIVGDDRIEVKGTGWETVPDPPGGGLPAAR
jgi:hypothetical protein